MCIRDRNYFAPAGSVAEGLYLQELRDKIVLSDADRALVKKLLAERNYETRTNIWDIAKHRLLGNAYNIARERHNKLVDKLGEDAFQRFLTCKIKRLPFHREWGFSNAVAEADFVGDEARNPPNCRRTTCRPTLWDKGGVDVGKRGSL